MSTSPRTSSARRSGDGSSVPERLVRTPSSQEWLALSPDGTAIAFAVWVPDVADWEIYTINADGSRNFLQVASGERQP